MKNYKINEAQKQNSDHYYFSKSFLTRIFLDSVLASTANLGFCGGLELGIGTGRRYLFHSGAFFFPTKLFKVPKYIINRSPQ
jgi:hypothetical protein